MTRDEKEQLKQEIICALSEKYSGVTIVENIPAVLSGPREKWFRAEQSHCGKKYYDSIMSNSFGSTAVAWKTWEIIRKLTCTICNVGRVSNLEDTKIANEIAEELCQKIYELRKKYMEVEPCKTKKK